MDYRNLGRTGLKISELSFGAWLTFGSKLDLQGVRSCMRAAYDAGVNFFDNAEAYGEGAAELLMGEALRDFKREDLVVSTKLFWGGRGPNSTGLSRKHLMEGINNSLRRLQLNYVDILFCHRADPLTPIEETVRALDEIVRSGKAIYWATSEWSEEDLEKAHEVALQGGYHAPVAEQPQYNLFCRERVEHEYLPLYQRYGMRLTTWSPLAFGVLSGKYHQGIMPGSRMQLHPELRNYCTEPHIEKVKLLTEVANDLDCTTSQLAIAWCLKNQHVASVITGATSLAQLNENLKAGEHKLKLTESVMKKIEEIITTQAIV